jgi:hypothetical protein
VIRIARAPEPDSLSSIKDNRLAAARSALVAGTKISFKGYGVAKSNLFAMQHHKCCYCEKVKEQAKYRDVEHFRPKAQYWWLTWTWENLLFACVDCNREHKKDQFPLAQGSLPLATEQIPPGGEHPLLIDPSDAAIDPMNEIEFRRDRVQRKERWVPYGLTPRGVATIDICGLARPGLLTLYTDHVNLVVRPKLEPLFSAFEGGDAKAVFKAWETAKRGLLHPAREFRALSHDALAVLVPMAPRERYNLPLTRPV